MKLKKGLFADDERSKKVKIYSAGKALFLFLIIWIAVISFSIDSWIKMIYYLSSLFGMAIFSIYLGYMYRGIRKAWNK